jgi:hypothetical protein
VVLDLVLDVDKDTVRTRKIKTATASPPQSVSGFDDFWTVYPRKEAKLRALKAWKKISESEHPKILEDVERRKRHEEWIRDRGKFIPHAAKYLSERRWEDQPASQETHTVPDGTPFLEPEPWVKK